MTAHSHPDLTQILAELRRPKLLVRAARFGLRDYNRARDLKRLMRRNEAPRPVSALIELIAQEAELEMLRKNGEAGYSLTRHIEILIAVMAEARLVRIMAATPKSTDLSAT
ncbi:hypothetical protein DL1_20085 [Thioclava dalianensis]|uniref:Uncharacterized protein n=1 Tax=Thioclava dalianensis TaxID=1185766 RepID=A0A074TM54_9RHOB|nr:DUF6477 family protein [Thioclava dalianensis]KEP70083.1 hypothetical protein DL1_20085 [Thioclava dalianensis]SFN51720.1 hypothetical protein SAMN05216224_106155 [Thioclava dalianensis]